MYEWHGKKYWGAAHGLAGIMHVLMHTDLKPDEQDDVKSTLRYMIKNRFPSGNYPSSEGNESDRLVHWCHGAPGVALTLAKAYEVIASSVYTCFNPYLFSLEHVGELFSFNYRRKKGTTPVKYLVHACQQENSEQKEKATTLWLCSPIVHLHVSSMFSRFGSV